MDLANTLILTGAGLIVLSIFAGLLSSRIGAPLLLVFLVIGMLAGVDGPGGIVFDDFVTAYMVGSIALAVILFDGGLRTSLARFRTAMWPSILLATVGVALTAAITGAAAMWLFGLGWVEGLLVGSIIASTDAAAVFFLLHLRGMRLKERVGATLEVESGLNDPMAIFLTLMCVELLVAGAGEATWDTAGLFIGNFAQQFLGGIVMGLVGGAVLLVLVNRLRLASGLYPILALAGALLIFSTAQTLAVSGFLAAYLAGLILGNFRHRATQIINRFHDGLAWLAQIAMFLLLGLLVTPSELLPTLMPALGIAAVLILLARPIAVLACLLPFGYTRQETLFVSWVGLRGAVPIFLGVIPVIGGVEHAHLFFSVACIVVIVSLVVQGWTVTDAARRLDLELPRLPDEPERVDIDLPADAEHDMVAYTAQPQSMAVRRSLSRLPMPPQTSIVSVMRDGTLRSPQDIERFYPGDYVLIMAPADTFRTLDRLFGRKTTRPRGEGAPVEAGFIISGQALMGRLGDLYEFPVPPGEAETEVGAFLRRHMWRKPRTGHRLRLGPIEIVIRKMDGPEIKQVEIDLEPRETSWRLLDPLRIWPVSMLRLLTRRLFWHRLARQGARQDKPDQPAADQPRSDQSA
jgi:cell volume regulation protein A